MEQSKPVHGHGIAGKDSAAKNQCFACSKDNPDGMHLKFYLDEAARKAICHFTLTQRYTGPPGHSHGGIIATILDEAMGKVNKFRNVLALTKSMQVEYLHPVPLEKQLTVTGYEQSVEGRKHVNGAEISNADGVILARSTGTFIA